jgi:hypothetical protein
MLHEVVYRVPPQPSQLADVSPAVEAVLAIALAKDADDRFVSAGEFARALASAAGDRLPRTLQSRADAIMARAPWGHSVRRRADTRRDTVAERPLTNQ